MIRHRAIAILGVLLLAAPACVPDPEPPEIRLEGVRLGGLGLTGGVLYVRLGVANPNDFALAASGLTYDLDLRAPAAEDDGWVDVAEGRFRERVRVGAEDSTVIEIPIEFRYEDVGAAIRSIMATGALDYRVEGTVELEDPLSTEIPYDESGTISLTGG